MLSITLQSALVHTAPAMPFFIYMIYIIFFAFIRYIVLYIKQLVCDKLQKRAKTLGDISQLRSLQGLMLGLFQLNC
jgi:hypothetical protein